MFEKSSNNEEIKDLDQVILNNQDTLPTLQRSPKNRNLPELIGTVKTEDQSKKLNSTQNLNSEKVVYTEDFDKSFLDSNSTYTTSSLISESDKAQLLPKDQDIESIEYSKGIKHSSLERSSSLSPTLTKKPRTIEGTEFSLEQAPLSTSSNSPDSHKKSPNFLHAITKIFNSPDKSKSNSDELKRSKKDISPLNLSGNDIQIPDTLRRSPTIERVKREDESIKDKVAKDEIKKDKIKKDKVIEKSNLSKFVDKTGKSSPSCSSQYQSKENKISRNLSSVIENQGHSR